MPDRLHRITDPAELPANLRGGVVAIGNFDGVHRGHQSVLDRARDIARVREVPALVLTFEPHPRSLFQPGVVLYRITPAPMKAVLIASEGYDAIVEQAFTREFASQSAEEFIDRILVSGLGITHVVTGFDFHFGAKRQGGPAYLMDAGERLGFGVTLVDAFRDETSDVVSSSRIRALLAAGEVATAGELLGYRYTVEAEVMRGKQLGRTIGFPTANMALPADNLLRHGIYAVRYRRENGDLYDGVASFGVRPTVETDGAPVLETLLFDFDGDLYGETGWVSFFSFLRGEEKFDDLAALKAQMKLDAKSARAILADAKTLSRLDRSVSF